MFVTKVPAYFLRVATLGIRILVPIGILAIFSENEMGVYYYWVTCQAFFVMLGGAELSVFFAKQFLSARLDKTRQGTLLSLVFCSFLCALFLQPIAIPITYAITDFSLLFIIIFAFTNVFESTVNEVGRFYWNIGDVYWPSLRDLIRSLAFSLSIFVSILISKEAISIFTLFIQMIFNIFLIMYELRKNNISIFKIGIFNFRSFILFIRRTINAVCYSASHIFHMQTLNSFPLFERVFLKFTSGYDIVAGYSFLLSIIQTVSGLSTISFVAEFRRKILKSDKATSKKSVSFHNVMMSFLSKITFITLLISILLWFTSDFLSIFFVKMNFIQNVNIFYLSIISIASVFCSGAAVVFLIMGKSIGIIVLSLLTTVCYVLAVIFYLRSDALTYDPVLVIAIVSLLNIGCRFSYQR